MWWIQKREWNHTEKWTCIVLQMWWNIRRKKIKSDFRWVKGWKGEETSKKYKKKSFGELKFKKEKDSLKLNMEEK